MVHPSGKRPSAVTRNTSTSGSGRNLPARLGIPQAASQPPHGPDAEIEAKALPGLEGRRQGLGTQPFRVERRQAFGCPHGLRGVPQRISIHVRIGVERSGGPAFGREQPEGLQRGPAEQSGQKHVEGEAGIESSLAGSNRAPPRIAPPPIGGRRACSLARESDGWSSAVPGCRDPPFADPPGAAMKPCRPVAFVGDVRGPDCAFRPFRCGPECA